MDSPRGTSAIGPDEGPLDAARVRARVEEILETGRAPEDVCGADPALLAAARARLARLACLEDELASLFPGAGTAARLAATSLPAIPGYELLDVLGHGGMGIVYRARHLGLGREVALKMLLSGEFASPKELARFQSEARAVANLAHPNIVQVFDVGDIDGRPYFTMELLAGGTLAQHLAGTPQPVAVAADRLRVLARAVAFAHQARIVHRDLKPANVLLGADGTPKIADFGLARRVGEGSLTASGAVLGTPSYMAPEQVRGAAGAIGPAVDVYALGAILYEMLTGRPPFRSESAWATQAQILAEDPVPPARLNARVPRDLETICLTCLCKEPERRYASAVELAEDLHRFQEGLPIAARPLGLLGRALRQVRRHPSRAALALTAAALLAVLSVAAAREWTLAARERAEVERWSERLSTVRALQSEGRFEEARAVLARMPSGGSAELRRELEHTQAELRLVERLDAIRARRGHTGRTDRYDPAAAEAYAAAFAEAGLGSLGEPVEVVAARLAASAARAALVAALDDWALSVRERAHLAWLMAVARRVDPDPWRDRVRDPGSWEDQAALATLARAAVPAEQPASLLVILGGLLDGTDAATPLLRSAQLAHPDDYWLNLVLAEALAGSEEEIAFLRAALAVRPRAIAPCVNLAIALRGAGRIDESAAAWQRALALEPGNAVVQANVALFELDARARPERALAHALEALRLDPEQPLAHGTLGRALLGLGRFDEAAEALSTAIARVPGDPWRAGLQAALEDCERMRALEARFPADPGADAPALAAQDLLQLALRARRTGRAAAAAGFYARAFAADPALAEAPDARHRYEAARAAAVAGTGSGGDAAERARWRGEALQWLWAELAAGAAELEESPSGRARLARRLADWRSDPDLAGVRDAAELEELAAEQREECRALWREVDALLAEARG